MSKGYTMKGRGRGNGRQPERRSDPGTERRNDLMPGIEPMRRSHPGESSHALQQFEDASTHQEELPRAQPRAQGRQLLDHGYFKVPEESPVEACGGVLEVSPRDDGRSRGSQYIRPRARGGHHASGDEHPRGQFDNALLENEEGLAAGSSSGEGAKKARGKKQSEEFNNYIKQHNFERQEGKLKCLFCPNFLKKVSTESINKHRHGCPKKTIEQKLEEMRNFVPSCKCEMNENEARIIVAHLSDFFHNNRISFNTVESDSFKAFMNVLHPSIVPYLPSSKVLGGTLLNDTHERSIAMAKERLPPICSILVDGWRNKSLNMKTVVCSLASVGCKPAFLCAKSFNDKRETGENLKDFVLEAREKALEMYNVEVDSVMHDNAANVKSMGEKLEDSHGMWSVNCSPHSGNLIIGNICEKVEKHSRICDKVHKVNKHFRKPDLQHQLLNSGGKAPKLAAETRWMSQRQMMESYLYNLTEMRNIATRTPDFDHDIKEIVMNEAFAQEVQTLCDDLQPICELINLTQREDCSIADVCYHWLRLEERIKPEYMTYYLNHKEKVVNPHSLTAMYLNPKYREDQPLSDEQMDVVKSFVRQKLSDTTNGMQEFKNYEQKSDIFVTLFTDHANDLKKFWNGAKMEAPDLSQLAEKLHRMPGSSASLERVFSQWSLVHTSLRNRLGFVKSEKLILIYFNNKYLEYKPPNENDEEEESDLDDMLDF